MLGDSGRDRPVDGKDVSPAEENIQVTAEMIEAGRTALYLGWGGYPFWPGTDSGQAELLETIFVAMLRSSLDTGFRGDS